MQFNQKEGQDSAVTPQTIHNTYIVSAYYVMGPTRHGNIVAAYHKNTNTKVMTLYKYNV
jgi:hypothetical protein